ncbi:MAG: hypothetical protein C0402_15815 [Thermodesulfovibrio sp.]|nr:hypothetical protein [Thermodesulfovibrio sp.]
MTKFCASSYNSWRSKTESALCLKRAHYQREDMSDIRMYAVYAVLYELNKRELKRKLDLFPAEMHYSVVLANSIIGSENAKRVKETPEAAVQHGSEFVARMLEVAAPVSDSGQKEVFREILETHLVETIKDELRCCCPNCAKFTACLDIGDLSLGRLFQRRVQGEETDELKNEIALEIEKALQSTPHIHTENASALCKDFRHQYTASGIGAVFSRYADIALGLQEAFGVDYRKIQQAMIQINMDFIAAAGIQQKWGE